ncbi:MAG: T9SS type A sorting domain-containing protein [Bacteroidota bacterium]|nr:T9SS type A sorting domain-containing protein [Bacteroidota bacterium]
MKKIYKTALFALMSNFAFAQSFFVPTTYRGAFEPTPAAMWTDNWTNWDPQNTVYPSPTVTVTASITVNTTWTSSNVYLLQGPIYVKAGATLTIQPGTIIMGDKASTGAGLFITKGSKIMAMGTAAQPIVFTSNQTAGSRALGDWGGIILMGKAANNQAGGIANIEGIAPSADTEYGGGTSPENDDNSGVMQYVRIEWGGYIYAPNKEINGITFGSVGSGTTIDHIQVSYSNDDAFEWFGGSVDCRYLVSYRNLDDDFDADFGYSGNVQFGLSVRDPALADAPAVSTSEGFETDNDATGSTASPQTSAQFSNMTLIGPYRGNTASTIATGYRRGARIRRNSALKIYNSIFMDHKNGVHIDGSLCEGLALSGGLKFKNNLMAGNSTGKVTETNVGSSFNIVSWFVSNNNDSLVSTSGILVNPYNYLAPDYRPAASSLALGNSDFTDATFTSEVLVAPSVTSAFSYCVGATPSMLTATGTNVGNTINWYTLPTGGTASTTAPTPSTASAGTFMYYVAQANDKGYEGPRATITVTVNPLPSTPMVTAGGPTSFCTGGTVVLTSNETTGNTWSTSATTQSITVNSTGNYSVMYTDANGCTATSAVTSVNVSSAPLPTVAVSGTTTLCAGETVTLTASVSDSYLWSPGGATTQSITVSTAGTYDVTTTNTNACNGVGTSSSTTVTVNAVPTANGSIASTTGFNVTFANTSTGATVYTWNFGDASSSSATVPTHAYTTNGTYTVQLIASNGTCQDTTTFTVTLAVGIAEIQTIGGINLYPNPVSQEATIDINLNEATEVVVIVYDMTGKVVANVFNGDMASGMNSVKIDASALPAGIYFANIISPNAKKTLKMVVIK